MSHAYSRPGTYGVTLRVIDDGGKASMATRLITVVGAEAAGTVESGSVSVLAPLVPFLLDLLVTWALLSMAYSAWYGWVRSGEGLALERARSAIAYGYSTLGGLFWRDEPRKKASATLWASAVCTLVDTLDPAGLVGVPNVFLAHYALNSLLIFAVTLPALRTLFPEKGLFNVLAAASVAFFAQPFALLLVLFARFDVLSQCPSLEHKLQVVSSMLGKIA